MKSEINILIKNTFDVFKLPLTSVELYENLICGGQSVSKNEFLKALKEMVDLGIIYTEDDYYFLKNEDMSLPIKDRIRQAKSSRSVCRKMKSKSKYLAKIGKLKYIGVYGIFNGYVLQSETGTKQKLMIITEKDASGSVIKKLNILFKLFGFKEKFEIETVLEEPIGQLEEKSICKAKSIISLEHIINKEGSFEKLIHRNLWIFEHFTNYPLNKLSMNYRVKT